MNCILNILCKDLIFPCFRDKVNGRILPLRLNNRTFLILQMKGINRVLNTITEYITLILFCDQRNLLLMHFAWREHGNERVTNDFDVTSEELTILIHFKI